MQTSVTIPQISHFFEFGWIEFEGFLSVDECLAIREEIANILKKRLHTEKLSRFGQDRLYENARDCWRNSTLLEHSHLSQRFTSTVVQLTNKQPILLAADQWVPVGKILEPLHLHDHMSFQSLVCGCTIFLDGDSIGRVRFFHPDRLPLLKDSQLLIAYAGINSVYVRRPLDPSNVFLKQFGYSFGDRIDAKANPLCRIRD